MRRRDRAVAGVAAAIALVAAHYEWFSIFGPPPRWGTGVVEVTPRFATHPLAESIEPVSSEGSTRDTAASASGVVGRVSHQDDVGPSGESLLQTFTGKTWGVGQHLYYRPSANAAWRELSMPRDFMIGSSRLVNLEGRKVVAFTRWNSWWPHDYGRFVMSVFRPELRAENGVYALDIENGSVRYLFPGSGLLMSGDRNYVATGSSTNGFAGRHTISIWDVRSNRVRPIFTDTEMDPGSGGSFGAEWDKAANYLSIRGVSQKYRNFDFIYSVADDVMYDLRTVTK